MNHLPKLFNRLTGYIFAFFTLFFLQSCCFGPVGTSSWGKNNPSQKPCNCYDKKKEVLAANQQIPQDKDAITASDKSSSAESLAINSIDEPVSQNPETKSFLVADNPDSGKEAVNNSMEPISVKTLQENEPVPATYKPLPEKENKLPLGIKGVKSWIVAGPNLSFKKHEGEDMTNYKRKAGVAFHAGFGSTYYFTDKVAFSPSIHFKQMKAGGKSTLAGESSFSETYTYNYLSVPLLAQFNITDGLSAFAGPEINYLLSGKSKVSYASETHKENLSKSSVKAGVGVQAGVKYNIPDTRFGVQLVYDYRISRVNKKQEGDDYYGGGGGYNVPAIRMSGFQLGITCSVCNKE